MVVEAGDSMPSLPLMIMVIFCDLSFQCESHGSNSSIHYNCLSLIAMCFNFFKEKHFIFSCLKM